MPLLTPADLLSILEAVKLVSDQFFVTPVEYRRTVGSIDITQEDRELTYETFNLSALRDTPLKDNSEDDDGSSDFSSVLLTFNVADFEDLGLWNSVNNVAILNDVKDRFILAGTEYEVDDILYDGPLQAKPVLIIIKGSKLSARR